MIIVDLNHLKYLVDVAQTQSITLSAKRLFISQQGLSQIILRLENEFKVPLLNRNRQGVTLTPAGEAVVEKAQEIVEKYQELLQSVRPFTEDNPGTLSGKLTIGVVPFISSNLLPEVLDLYHKQYPSVDVHIQEKQPQEIIEDINHCLVDIGLVILPEFSYNELIVSCNGTYEKVLENEMLAVVAKQSPLAKKKIITAPELYQQPIALYNFASYLDIMQQLFKDLSRLNILVKTNSVDLYKNAIIHRHAVGITPSTDTKLLSDDSLVTIQLQESVKLFYGYFVPASCAMTEATEAFLAILKGHIANIINRKK